VIPLRKLRPLGLEEATSEGLTPCLAFALETLSLSKRVSHNHSFRLRRGCYSASKEIAICLVLGVPLNGIRRTMQEVADELTINH
jgi:hypothetical protein